MGAKIVSLALYREVAERLRQMIARHQLLPGQRIDENARALEFGVSRTPMREALKVLQSEGLVLLVPRRGCFVAELSSRDTQEIFSILRVLEAEAARDLARAITAEQLAQLDDLHGKLERYAEVGALQRYSKTNLEFHDLVQILSGNAWRRGVVNELRQALVLSRRVALTRLSRMADSLEEHRALMAALHARADDLAAKVMADHLVSTSKGVVEPQEGGEGQDKRRLLNRRRAR